MSNSVIPRQDADVAFDNTLKVRTSRFRISTLRADSNVMMMMMPCLLELAVE